MQVKGMKDKGYLKANIDYEDDDILLLIKPWLDLVCIRAGICNGTLS